MKNYINLIESVQSGSIVLESFKDAQKKFNDEADPTEVSKYIQQFKELSKRNVIKGPDKDIGKWIKAGWVEFKNFVDSSSQVTSKRQMKMQTKKESIVIYEDEKVMLVIPLTEGASCYYGRNTKWCTAATETRNYFGEYFGEKEITLVYALFKNGDKMALALHRDIDQVEAFDSEDSSISPGDFEEAVGVSIDDIEKAIEKAEPVIEKARERQTPKYRMMEIVKKYKEGNNDIVRKMIEAIEEYYDDEDVEPLTYVELKSGGLGAMFDLDDIRNDSDFDNAVRSLDEVFDFYVDDSDARNAFYHDANPVYLRLVAQYILNNYGDLSYHGDELNEWTVDDVVDDIQDIIEYVDDNELNAALNLAYSDALRFDAEKQMVEALNEHCYRIATDLHFSMPEGSGYNNWYLYFADHTSVAILPEDIEGHIEYMVSIGGDIHGEYDFTPPDINPVTDDDEYNAQLEEMLLSHDIDTVTEYVAQRDRENKEEE